MLNANWCRSLLAVGGVAMLTCLMTACGSSAPPRTAANVTVCKQFATYNNSALSAANPLGTFESQWQVDAVVAKPSAQLGSDVTDYLTLMNSGGFAPGSGEQTQTAQAAVAISNYCSAMAKG